MDIIVKNGKLTIRGSNADRKAFATVNEALRQIAEFGGGGIGDDASECHGMVVEFLKKHEEVIEWTPDRKQPATT